jgi:hypothetical protein
VSRIFQKFCVLIIVLSICQNVFAVTQHTESWNSAIITGSLSKDKKLKYYIQPGLSFEDDKYKYRGTNLYLGFGYQTSPDIIVWLMNGWFNRLRPSGSYLNTDTIRQELDWNAITTGPFTLLSVSRLEERKNYSEPEWQIRFKEKLILRAPFNFWQNHSFVTFDEVFFTFNNPAWINCNSFFEKNNAFVGVGTRISEYVSFDLGYLNQFEMKTTGNQVNNVLYLMFNVTLP